jgi:hypothetical protein
MPTNVVLRFRDLNIDIGDTIKEHRNLIKASQYVWWGWWKKPEERVPYSVLRDFQNAIEKEGHIWIFLVDSGTMRLYKAKLININFTNNENPQECSEIDKVPEYYFSKKCFVWFCFGEINDANPDEIRAWVYDDPSDFLFDAEPDKFQRKRVTNIEEMVKSRHRTMYFLRPYNQNLKKNSFLELDNYSHQIMKLIEEINKYCDFSSKRAASPIQFPPYQKEMEERLKFPAEDEASFREFSSCLYILIIDGHEKVLKKDSAIITKDEFYRSAHDFLRNIRIFRCNHHHSSIGDNERIKLGRLYKEVCGKNVLDDSDSRIKFQAEMLKRTVNLLKKELDLVKIKVDQLAA